MHKLDKHDIIKEVRKMKRGDEVESILVEVYEDHVIVTGYNNKQTPIVIRKKIPAPCGVDKNVGEKIII